MSKAKPSARQPVVLEPEDELILPETWRRRPWIPVVIGVALLAVILGAGFAMDKAVLPAVPAELSNCKTSTQIGPHEFAGRQPICIKAGKVYTAHIDTTQGEVDVELLPQYAPVTVNNFVVLAVNGYYNGLAFWDVPDWEVQTGDPNENGTGGPGYNLPEEPSDLPWLEGAVGMAAIPGGPINGSQFFIEKAIWPTGGPTQVYNRFGTVTAGIDHVSALSPGDRVNTITISVSNPVVSPSR